MGLFEPQLSRKPNLYPDTQRFIDAIWVSHWTPNEFNFKSDYSQFHTQLSEQEKEVVVRALSAIGQIEIAVKTFWGKLGENLPHPALSDLGYVMANNEVIHNQAYEKLLTVLGLEKVFEQNLKQGVIADRVKYLRKYLERTYKDDRKQYIYAICLFTLFVENVSLFSQFYTIMYFNRFRNYLKDTAQQIQYTRNEEMLHAQVGIYLITTLRAEYPDLFDDELVALIRQQTLEAYEAECRVIDWILGDFSTPELNKEVLKAYILNRLEDSLDQIGFSGEPLAPLDEEALAQTIWMDEETLGSSKSDFFHKKPVDYAKNSRVFDEGAIF